MGGRPGQATAPDWSQTIIPTPSRAAPPLLLLALASFTSMAALRGCDALLPLLATDFNTTTGAAAQTISAFAIAYGVLQLAYGPLGDRLGKTRVMAAATAACALANAAVACAPTLEATIAWRAVAGGTSGGIVPLSLAIIGDAVAYERRQEVLARLMMATITGMIAGQWLGGVVGEALGWRWLFGMLAIAFAAVAIPLVRTAARHAPADEAGPAGAAGVWQRYAQVFATPWARRVLAAVSIEGGFAFATFSFVPSFLHHDFGLSLSWSGAVMALYGAGGMVYALTARTLVRRLGEAGLTRGGGLALGLAFALLAFAPAWGWALPACAIGGLGLYMLHSTLQTHGTQMVPAQRGTAVSLFAVCLFASQAVGVSLAAAVVDRWSPRWVFGVGMVVAPLLGWWFSHSLQRRPTAPAG